MTVAYRDTGRKENNMTTRKLKSIIKKAKPVDIKRLDFGEYYVDMERFVNEFGEDEVDFWLGKKRGGDREFLIGWPLDQTKAKLDPKVYTPEEAAEICLWDIERHIAWHEHDEWLMELVRENEEEILALLGE